MRFAARWGSACGLPFNASAYLTAHPQFDWMQQYLKSRPSQPWTEFSAGEKAGTMSVSGLSYGQLCHPLCRNISLSERQSLEIAAFATGYS